MFWLALQLRYAILQEHIAYFFTLSDPRVYKIGRDSLSTPTAKNNRGSEYWMNI